MQVEASDELVQNQYLLRHAHFGQVDLHHFDDVLNLLFELLGIERGAVLKQSQLRFGQVERSSSGKNGISKIIELRVTKHVLYRTVPTCQHCRPPLC